MIGGNIMKTKRFILMGAILTAFISITGFQDSPHYKILFEKAKFTMETKGDLNGAIDLFNEIIQEYPKEREYAAKSQLYIGLCYEKLGLEEAQKAYRKVLDNYPEQKQEVALAKENLNRLLAAIKNPTGPVFRKINIPTELPWTVKLSPDGKNLALVFDKKLWSLPLEGNLGPGFSGTPVLVDTDSTDVDWSGLFWSYDTKWIAFNEYIGATDYSSLSYWIYIVPSVGGKPKKVFQPFRGPRTVNFQISISPDGNKIAFSSVKDEEQHIYSISVEGGNPVKLTDMEAREPVFSPDGKMIAFAADRGIGRGEGDLGLWVVPSDGGTPHLVANAIKATSPIWSPDGNMIAYIDEEQPRLSIVRIDKMGRAVGKPFSVDALKGTSFIKLLAGWTPENKIGTLLVTEQESAIYTLPVYGGQAAMIQHNPGAFVTQPRWSPDGKQVYYSAPPEEANSEGIPFSWSIPASVSSNGGNGKPVACDLNDKKIRLFRFYGGGNRVSPDGKTIVAGAWTPEDVSSEYVYPQGRIWKIALDGTGSTQITKTKGSFIDTDPCWSPDGSKIAFIRHKLSKSAPGISDEDIYIVDSSGGEPQLLDSVPGRRFSSLDWSPDGKMLACFVWEKEPPGNTRNNIYVSNIENRKAGTVGEIQGGINYAYSELAWSPDSKRIAYNFNDNDNSGIKVMTLSDGSIEEIKTGLSDIDRIVHFDWSPDGEKFVFIGWKNGKKEFWFVEDFLR
jgi:Tol biopolymer transport system component